MKKTTAAILGLALSFTAHATSVSDIINGTRLTAKSSLGISIIVAEMACKAGHANLDGAAFAQGIYKHYSALHWSQASFDQLIDTGFEFADQHPTADCGQIAINMLDAK